MTTDRPEGYDVIGDVHGHAGKLLALLGALGYEERDGVWAHPSRVAVFVGDLIDTGPEQVETIATVRAMVDAGAARVVLANHEFNAVAYHTPDPENPGEYLRPHVTKNRAQHERFLHEVGGTATHDDLIDWFRTLPLWLELELDEARARVVHACWDEEAMAAIGDLLAAGNSLTRELVEEASREGTAEHRAIEHLLKGPEIPVPVAYLDKNGHVRHRARFRWWDPHADRLPRAVLLPADPVTVEGEPYPPLPDEPIHPPVPPYRDEVPVFYGHYWRTGEPSVTSGRTACVDYSAGRNGPLVAYRWNGEAVLTNEHFVQAG